MCICVCVGGGGVAVWEHEWHMPWEREALFPIVVSQKGLGRILTTYKWLGVL